MAVDIKEIVFSCIREAANLEAVTEETVIVGDKGALDSMSVVTLIVEVEQKLSEALGKKVSIAEEGLFAPGASPMKSAQSFFEYVEKALANQGV